MTSVRAGHAQDVQWAIDAALENPHGSVIVDSQRLASLAAVVTEQREALERSQRVVEAAQMFVELEGGCLTRYGNGWYALTDGLAALSASAGGEDG